MSLPLKKFSKTQLIDLLVAQEKQFEALKIENTQLKQNALSLPGNKDDFFSLRQIIALMPGTVFWKTKSGIYLGCNNNLAAFLGFDSPDDIIGKTNIDLMGAELAEPLDKIDKEIMDAREGRYIEEMGMNINNEFTIFFTQKIPLQNQAGEVIGLLGISIDITERKKIEKELLLAKEIAEVSNQAKSEFLAVINHELRTPLTGILGLIDILKENNPSLKEIKQITSDLENCAQYLLSLVNDVLDFSQLEAGKKNINVTPVSLPEIISDVTSIVAALAKNKNLVLQTSIDKRIPSLIMTDALILHQILINVINNAIKFTDKGHVTIELKCVKQIVNMVEVEIAIHDSGKGIPNDQLDLIFNPFKQLDNTYIRSSSRRGTGLGLAIVKKLTELLHIDIRVESKIGKGSSFYLTGKYIIHEKYFSNSSSSIHPKGENFLTANEKKIKILIVEDDQIVQHIYRKILVECGYEIDIANSGEEALRLFHQHDIIFVDIGLPDLNGFQLIEILRNQADIDKNLPIIALTGYTGEKEKSACLKAGANEVILKPISANKLRNIINRYFHLLSPA